MALTLFGWRRSVDVITGCAQRLVVWTTLLLTNRRAHLGQIFTFDLSFATSVICFAELESWSL